MTSKYDRNLEKAMQLAARNIKKNKKIIEKAKARRAKKLQKKLRGK